MLCSKTGALESGLYMLHKMVTQINYFFDVTKESFKQKKRKRELLYWSPLEPVINCLKSK